MRSRWARVPVAAGRNVLLYIVLYRPGRDAGRGAGSRAFHLVELDHDGDMIELEAGTKAIALIGDAAWRGEPVMAHGPFVKNSREDIRQAIRSCQAGRAGGLPAIG